ncbi:MAG: chemotaxis protein CheA [Phycisphaeraceae bacterium]|nr:chemotaxis protein CheA [Phycisphaeraceae bacterium]MCW5762789.1 chemotaxis protein CheA [Phycisphaeraceae bacterium]
MSLGGFEPEIIHDFLTEAGELLEQLERDLGAMESSATPDPGRIDQAFRALHTIKGSASFLALGNMVEIAHAAESALNAVRIGRAGTEHELIGLLLAASGVLGKQLEQMHRGVVEIEAAPESLVKRLNEIGQDRGACVVEVGERKPWGVVEGDDDANASGGKAGASENTPEATIRVEVERLETLMNLVGELVIEKNRIVSLVRGLEAGATPETQVLEAMETSSQKLAQVTTDIQNAVMRARMQPLSRLFGRYRRVIRELATKTGKQIRLVVEGGETELDKFVIEALNDPLVHLMRNSADHGIETRAERLESGKDAIGTIALRAIQDGSCVQIVMHDNGRGLSREKIAAKAVERGLATTSQVAAMSDDEVFRFIFTPGFSTAEQVSDLSGRGVGMDVVRTNVERLGGEITVGSVAGRGTTIRVRIPLSIAVLPVVLAEVSCEIYALPLSSVVEIVQLEDQELKRIVQTRVLRIGEREVPAILAAEAFGVKRQQDEVAHVAVVLRVHEQLMALVVSDVIGQEEVVVKPMTGQGERCPFIGASVGTDGCAIWIVEVDALARWMLRSEGQQAVAA